MASAAEVDKLKKERASAKSKSTRTLSRVKVVIAQGKVEVARALRAELDDAFAVFTDSHDKYVDVLVEEEPLQAAEDYYEEQQTKYICAIEELSRFLSKYPVKTETNDEVVVNESTAEDKPPSMSVDVSPNDMITMMHMPQVQLEAYDGDPMTYHMFMTSFEQSVDTLKVDQSLKLARLLQFTTGPAKEAIRKCALDRTNGYQCARKILEQRFGNNHLVSEKLISDLCHGKQLKSPVELQQFSDDLSSTYQVLDSIKMLDELNVQHSIISMVERLPVYVQRKWRRQALEFKKSQNKYPDLSEFVKFVGEEAADSSDPVYGKFVPGKSRDSKKPVSKYNSFSTQVTTDKSAGSHHQSVRPKEVPCVLCKERHRLWHCKEFKGMQPSERLSLVKQYSLCENCLRGNHTTDECLNPNRCSTCKEKHTRFLHIPAGKQVTNANVHANSHSVHMPVVEVVVNGTYRTYALLDTASSSSFATQDLVSKAQLKGSKIECDLNTLGQSQKISTSVVKFRVTSTQTSDELQLDNVLVTSSIPVQSSEVNTSTYPQFSGLRLAPSGAKVDVLIGQDNAEALVPLDIRTGKKGEPYAVRTLFGWVTYGKSSLDNMPSKSVISNFISTAGRIKSVPDDLSKLWDLKDDATDDIGLSQSDQKVVNLWNQECQVTQGGHYELPIPWKEDIVVPNNLAMALQRLHSLRATITRKGIFMRYDEEIKKLLMKGYAELVPVSEVSDSSQRIWYLPHHAVITPKKPDKVRIVFDCAAKFQGESLNDKCLQGPDLNNNLLHVMLRFRQHYYVIMGDVESMYYQVKIPERDRNALRFLWYDDQGEIVHYRMTGHVFGGVWCASSSIYALHQVVEDYCTDPVLEDVIKNAFYVDDCLKSVPDRETAVMILNQCPSLLEKGGFNLTKLMSNDDVITQSIPASKRLAVDSCRFDDVLTKALGTSWNATKDKLYFEVNTEVKCAVTRRDVLSAIASFYDPLGLISPLVIKGKVIFQEATKLKLCWDDTLPKDLTDAWIRWLQSLQEVRKLQFDRCIKPSEFDDAALELHHFSDASEVAYGSCSYLRAVNKKGKVYTCLIMAKGKVAPIKKVTLPRLELQAAVLSVKLDQLLKRALELEFIETHFWTDSELVLKYLKNQDKRFQVFVANRVSFIMKSSEVGQWHHVPGEVNPADIVSRGSTVDELNFNVWCKGPKFLKDYKSKWKCKEVDSNLQEEDPEVKRHATVNQASTREELIHPLEKLINYYSSWHKLRKAVCWLLKLQKRWKDKVVKPSSEKISVMDMEEAEAILLHYVQRHLKKDVKKGAVDKKLSKLCPYIDGGGHVRVGGRVTQVNTNAKGQLILPKGAVCDMIIRDYHALGHLGSEYVLSQVREKYWTSKKNVRTVLDKCILCKKIKGRTCGQKMSILPESRIKPGDPPFTEVGIDCFGPFLVKRGRAQVKRYGCIFVCMSIKAIHIEKLEGLDTDSFLNGLFRFMSRRNKPKRITSDNGTNFVGANRELAEAIQLWNQTKIKEKLLQRNIEWKFNPPHASHMGGIWERQIRTIRQVLSSLMKEQVVSDDVLSTLFCEIEAILNNRPITPVSEDVDDFSVLKPSHLLNMKEGPELPPCITNRGDLYKGKWKQVQYLADIFWRRWIKQYLPSLQVRSKWNRSKVDVKEGDIVLLLDENVPRNLWPMGRVLQAIQGRDGMTRSARIRTKSTVLTRPIHKLVLLEGSLVP